MPHFTLIQVALNDAIMVFAFAPIVALLLGLSAIAVPWQTLLLSVALYIVVPVIISQVIRRSVLASGGEIGLSALLCKLGPMSIVALLATLVLLFGFQGKQILAQTLIIAMLVAALAAAVTVSLAAAQAQWTAQVANRRDKVQAQSIALAGIAWTRQILDADGRMTSIDHPREPWALPLPATPVENGEVEA